MKKLVSIALVTAVLFAAPAFAADPVVGTWKLNVAKSKFGGTQLKAATRVYSESNGVYTLEQTQTAADGKETSNKVSYRDGQEEKQPAGAPSDAILAKKVDANTWTFELKKDGKTIGRVHRKVSADGKTLTVQNKGAKLSGAKGDETLVFDKE